MSNTSLETPTFATKSWNVSIALAIFYAITHLSGLGRELSYEESIFITPGLRLFNGEGFSFDWGLLAPEGNAFHKPPLLSLILGSISWLTPNSTVGLKAVPFLCVLFACLLPYMVTGRIVGSIGLILSPLFLAASSHIQTDSTVVILGYGYFIYFLYQLAGDPQHSYKSHAHLFLCFALLSCGKLEYAVVSLLVLTTYICLTIRGTNLIKWLTLSVMSFASSVSLMLALSYALGKTAGLQFNQSAMEVINTVTRISGSSSIQSDEDWSRIVSRSKIMLANLSHYQAGILCAILTVPILVWMIRFGRREQVDRRRMLSLSLAALVPTLIYLTGGYVGDGFPRYFLGAIIAFAVLASHCSKPFFDFANTQKVTTWTAILLLPLVLAPTYLTMSATPAAPVYRAGDYGYSGASAIAEALGIPKSTVIAPEPCIYYLKHSEVLALESFEPYPANHPKVMELLPTVTAIIVPSNYLQAPPSPFVSTVLGEFRKNKPAVLRSGSLTILIKTIAHESPAQ